MGRFYHFSNSFKHNKVTLETELKTTKITFNKTYEVGKVEETY